MARHFSFKLLSTVICVGVMYYVTLSDDVVSVGEVTSLLSSQQQQPMLDFSRWWTRRSIRKHTHTQQQQHQEEEDWGSMKCEVPELTSPHLIYDYITQPQIKCDKPVMVGGQLLTHPPYMVGEKWVCMGTQYNITPGDCVVLSFGIENDFSFDDDMDKRFNCKVYAFDPTINLTTHQRSPNIKFHNLGIGYTDGSIQIRKIKTNPDLRTHITPTTTTINTTTTTTTTTATTTTTSQNHSNTITAEAESSSSSLSSSSLSPYIMMKVPVARYTTILDLLHLQNRTIDYLKMDVESSELAFFSDVLSKTPNLLKNVKQIGMEIHMSIRPDVGLVRERLWAYFHHLDCYGFKLVFSEINPVKTLRFNFRDKERSCCYEMVWARQRQW
ncbi:hypothetical protein Pmani_018239 [Petrolisthes manimaculis]|uniref:Methyltransferase domain-containing protein n=1 Tax=Petrolisthes manimaculis TaxID=1843537 RepID=A0AAE1U6W0_9EUCA|nr:hypothetical protein Pmani_018239 [Petrolisthes manimaculis]